LGLTVAIRKARPGEDDLLKQITVRSQATWGYDATRFRAWAERLDFPPDEWRDVEPYVAEIDAHPVGWVALRQPADALSILEELWIEPEWMQRGVGADLFRFAAGRARELGADTLEWASEPGAVGFYEKLGGRHVRDDVSSSFGHRLPVMRLDLRPNGVSAPSG
jgi:GNAT superfamily N-acetyltransferase